MEGRPYRRTGSVSPCPVAGHSTAAAQHRCLVRWTAVQSHCSWLPRSHLCSSGHFIPVPDLHRNSFLRQSHTWAEASSLREAAEGLTPEAPFPREPNHQISTYLGTLAGLRTKISALMKQGFKLHPPKFSFHKLKFSSKVLFSWIFFLSALLCNTNEV